MNEKLKGSVRKERLAVNLFDLDRLQPELRTKFFAGRLDLTTTIEVEHDRMVRTRAVVFICDLLTAATIIDILRSENRREGDDLVRAYISKGTAWARILNRAMLTLNIGGEIMLNPEMFPPDVNPEDLAPPPLRPVVLGRKS